MRRWTCLTLAAVAAMACSDSPADPVGTGSLAVAITGLPSGAQASVTVTGTTGFSRALTANTILTALPPGRYTIAAAGVTIAGDIFVGAPATQSVSVTNTVPVSVTVTYVAADVVTLTLETVATGLDNPVFVTAPIGDPRLFVVEQTGRIRVIADGELLSAPFLDLRARVSRGGEQGLLSLAFHPSYQTNGLFFVNYTDTRGDTQVERYRVSPNPNVADPGTVTPVLTVSQPFANHNGGLVMFGPDEMLYVGMGDGGSGGDPQGNGQNMATLLGKMLRIDVSVLPYIVPNSNPFVNRAGTRPEIWASGLRNPWRFSFDRRTGLLFIADVGQNDREEINVVGAAQGGLNYGWNTMEGTVCYARATCVQTGLTLPMVEYRHSDGCSITGGYTYRGTRIPEIVGRYFYTDFCSGWLRSFRVANGAAISEREWPIPRLTAPTSFGEDSQGELYITVAGGTVFRLARR